MDGQGAIGKSVKNIRTCLQRQCEKECTKDIECKGLDFYAKSSGCSCRLFTANIPRTDGGGDKRKYCKKIESKA